MKFKIALTLSLCCAFTTLTGCATAITCQAGTGLPFPGCPSSGDKAEPAALLFLPVAVPFDIITLPIQLPFILGDKRFIDG